MPYCVAYKIAAMTIYHFMGKEVFVQIVSSDNRGILS